MFVIRDERIVHCEHRRGESWRELCHFFLDFYYHCMYVQQNKICVIYLFMICSIIYIVSEWHHLVTEEES